MQVVFVDTSAWVALNSKRDALHTSAIQLNRQLLSEGCRYVTSNFVIDETLTTIRMQVSHAAAVDFGERLRQSKVIDVVHVDDEIEDKAWDIFKSYADKDFSFTDCTSFVIMQLLDLTDALTHDHHFVQFGFAALL